MVFSRHVSLVIDGNTAVQVVVSFQEQEAEPDEFRIAIYPHSNDLAPMAESVWHVREKNGSFQLQIFTQSIVTGICLAGCLASVVAGAGPLVECLKKAKTRADVRKCIDTNAVAQVVASLSCIYGCLSL